MGRRADFLDACKKAGIDPPKVEHEKLNLESVKRTHQHLASVGKARPIKVVWCGNKKTVEDGVPWFTYPDDLSALTIIN